ncbi:MAG: NAD(P)/FAD-dependent oxidoreductase [Lachnospiraceae bacterium]|nr:NAD(P)/FAD-dependent oxidoreductase [Lachnospiraceae bacterium]
MYDVIIIGAGVCGCAAARELSRYALRICVLDKCTDVCEGTSKANSAIIHAGFDARPGTMMARMNVRGNRMMDEISSQLDFPFLRTGSMVVCRNADEVKGLEELLERGKENGVPDLKILSHDEAAQMEPGLADSVYAALYAPTGGIVCPFQMTIAYAENAVQNGVEFRLATEVLSVHRDETGYRLITNHGELKTRCVVNAAGVYADTIHNMVSSRKMHITPRRGEYFLLDKAAGKLVAHTIFQLPTAMGKGVLITPTVHGNLLVGPTAVDQEDKEGTYTTADGLHYLEEKAKAVVKDLPMKQVITSFAGLRAHEDGGEFIIREVMDARGFVDVAGIESPGLSSAPAIAEYVRDIIVSILNPVKNEKFMETRKGLTSFASLPRDKQKELIEKEPSYGRVICRCETVTEGEILEAIRRPLGATTLDGIKRRTRAGMGRCQAGFCTPKVMEILAREQKVPLSGICKNGQHSKLIVGINKDQLQETNHETA